MFNATDKRLILGPPGTGKTHTLLGLYEDELARGVHPSQIAYVSFTRKAAGEAKERARDRFPDVTDEELQNISTLHSISFRHAGFSRGEVMSGADINAVSQLAGMDATSIVADSETGIVAAHGKGADSVRLLQLAQATHSSPEKIFSAWVRENRESRLGRSAFTRFLHQYEHYKRTEGKSDFNDMLVSAESLGPVPKIRTAFIDEAQDLSPQQWRTATAMFSGCEKIIAAGDDDQSIYEWAGADIQTFRTLDMRTQVLGQSYRLSEKHVRFADQVSERIYDRYPKEWHGGEHESMIRFARVLATACPEITESDESWLFLVRIRSHLREIIDELYKLGLLFYLPNGKRSIDEELVRAIQGWTALGKGKSISIHDARRIYNLGIKSGKDSIGHGGKKALRETERETVSLQQLQEEFGLRVPVDLKWFETYGHSHVFSALDVPTREYIRRTLRRGEALDPNTPPRIKVATIHGAKGGEADNVVVMAQTSRKSHVSYARPRPERDAENRVWYVAATRPRKRLVVVTPFREHVYKYPRPRRIM